MYPIFITEEISSEISGVTRLSYISLCDCEAICACGEATFLIAICGYKNTIKKLLTKIENTSIIS